MDKSPLHHNDCYSLPSLCLSQIALLGDRNRCAQTTRQRLETLQPLVYRPRMPPWWTSERSHRAVLTNLWPDFKWLAKFSQFA